MKQETIFYDKMPYSQDEFFQSYVRNTQNQPYHVLLESGRSGKYSIAGVAPFARIQASEDHVEITQNGQTEHVTGNPLAILEEWMSTYTFEPINDLPEFQGGAIGYISYDYGWQIEKLPNLATDDIQLPTMYFLIFDEWVIYDHEQECVWFFIINKEKSRLDQLKAKWIHEEGIQKATSEITATSSERDVSFTEEQFVDAVKKVQDFIREGDAFQVNLTVRQSMELGIPPLAIYQELRQLNPSPYMGYMHTPEFQIISGSPELLIQKEGATVKTRPIGGTRPRGVDAAEDKKYEEELLTTEKERAEHIMLVDIERNDLGRVCKYGTVKVDQLLTIEKYSHVMHLVSHVSGELDESYSAFQLIDAVFPGGTITGAPKIRTIEIIEELEPVKRGIYTGSIGWIGFNQDLHLNIVIRTMLVKDGICYVQAGAGIVIDSDPKSEYEESLRKAQALWKAKEEAEKKVYNQ